MQKKPKIFHPFIFAIYPILALAVANLAYIQPTDPLRILVVSLLVSAIIWGIFRLLLHDWMRSGLLTTIFLILFYSYGHVITLLESFGIEETLFLNLILLVIWGVIFIATPIFLLKPAEWQPKVSMYLNWVGLILLFFLLVNVAGRIIPQIHLSDNQEAYLYELHGGAEAEGDAAPIYPGEMPNIYYIILDQYARTDVLEEFYDYDNSAFIEALETRGFYIAKESRSNYLRTNLSIPSSLSSIYIHNLPDEVQDYVLEDFSHSYVANFLQSQGYEVNTISSGIQIFRAPWAETTVSGNVFELLVSYTTVYRVIVRQGVEARFHDNDDQIEFNNAQQMQKVGEDINSYRATITNAFEHIPKYAESEGSHFIFAHIYSPHFPYVFGPDGEFVEFLPGLYNYLRDPSSPEDLSHYLDQTTYLNKQVIAMVDEILANSKTPPIIILQSDHGHDSHIDYDHPDQTGLHIRSAILNAYYLPDGAEADLYPSISPVNSFRVIFNHWFNTNYAILPDDNFHYIGEYSAFWQRPEFFSICEKFDICSP
ncbi:MAG: sulfatase-like hydrolase/transferase [Anaerolineales bacterium]|nr:sulfatase-like hydrolase/transferase [Anaerolineales bacterium]